MYWDAKIETISREQLIALQLKRLKVTVKQAANSPHYRKALAQGPRPEDIKTLADVTALPFTTKEDLRNSFPYGMLAVPKDDIIRLHSSSGTTGRATVVYHTQSDIANWADIMARSIYMAGVRRSDVFQNVIGYGLFTGGLGFHYGMERVGALVIPSGTGNSKRQISLMRDFDTTVIHATPSYALHLAEVFAEVNLDPARDVKLRIGFFGAEPYTEATRQRLEQIYDIQAINSFGLSEMNGPGVAMECPEKKGVHLWEDHFLLEIVHPQKLTPLPDGEVGEIVLTTLCREGMPLIRYRTRDLSYVYTDACPCGRTHRRLARIMGRTDDMLIVSGVNIFPMQIEKVLMDLPQVGHHYLIELKTREHLDEIHVKVEVRDESLFGDLEALKKLKKKITEDIRSEILVGPQVELVEPGSLPRSEGKAVRVVDKREK